MRGRADLASAFGCDDEVEEPAAAEQIKCPKTCPVQRASAGVDRISSEDCELADKPLDLKDDGRRKLSDGMLGVGVVRPGPGVTRRWPLGARMS